MNGITFFFKQKTAYEISRSDWSSDVCSSDLAKMGKNTCGNSANFLTPGIGNREGISACRCKGIRCKTGAVPAAVILIKKKSVTTKATDAAMRWEGDTDRGHDT